MRKAISLVSVSVGRPIPKTFLYPRWWLKRPITQPIYDEQEVADTIKRISSFEVASILDELNSEKPARFEQ
jgi:hypothetical protein